ncbi:hypothetical protein PIB30_037955 [Stylosanthes scabra]|uniref:RING-type domain-containing protein n=1 Tax=Stylosanthes scabra TaxID=79078 RepID=A0ABU6WC59_9FABA|nr:hypothetical protein [Stylosanthes scabra]
MNHRPPSPSSPSSSCNTCGASMSRWTFLHSLSYRANSRRYCTNCLLKNHHGLFCPICFQVYEESLSPHLRLICLRCPAIAHRSCVTSDGGKPSASTFKCPACSDPKFSYFRPMLEGEELDTKSALVLVAAAQISAESLSKAAAASRLDAERRAMDAAAAKNRAREALDRLARIVAMENEQQQQQKPKQKKKKKRDGAEPKRIRILKLRTVHFVSSLFKFSLGMLNA